MKTINIGNSGIQASEISLGCMRIANSTVQEVRTLIDVALEEGINFLIMQIFMLEEKQKKFLLKH